MNNWKHYVFEFILIFLAVSAGFLAENLREQYREKQQIRIYASLLFEETKVDTMFLHKQQNLLKVKIKEVDTLLYYLSQPAPGMGSLYHYSRTLFQNLIPVDMKAFVIEYVDIRLISNINLVNMLFAYRDELDTYQNCRSVIIEISDDLHAINSELFDSRLLHDNNFNSRNEPPRLLSSDPITLNRYHYMLHLLRQKLEQEYKIINERIELAEHLNVLLQQEYSL